MVISREDDNFVVSLSRHGGSPLSFLLNSAERPTDPSSRGFFPPETRVWTRNSPACVKGFGPLVGCEAGPEESAPRGPGIGCFCPKVGSLARGRGE